MPRSRRSRRHRARTPPGWYRPARRRRPLTDLPPTRAHRLTPGIDVRRRAETARGSGGGAVAAGAGGEAGGARLRLAGAEHLEAELRLPRRARRSGRGPTARRTSGGRCAGSPAGTPRARGPARPRRRARRPARPAGWRGPSQGLVAADAPPGEDQVEGVAVADQPRQPDGAAVDQRHAPAPAVDAEDGVGRPPPAGRTRAPARARRRRRGPRRRRSPASTAASGSGPSDRRSHVGVDPVAAAAGRPP